MRRRQQDYEQSKKRDRDGPRAGGENGRCEIRRYLRHLAALQGAHVRIDRGRVHGGLPGDVVGAKRKEADALRLRPHPYEFYLYYDV